jgi:hypothetical protein
MRDNVVPTYGKLNVHTTNIKKSGKWTSGVASVVQHLPNKCSTTPQKNLENIMIIFINKLPDTWL